MFKKFSFKGNEIFSGYRINVNETLNSVYITKKIDRQLFTKKTEASQYVYVLTSPSANFEVSFNQAFHYTCMNAGESDTRPPLAVTPIFVKTIVLLFPHGIIKEL